MNFDHAINADPVAPGALLDVYTMSIGLLVFVINFIGMLMMFPRKYKLYIGILGWIAVTVLISAYRRLVSSMEWQDWKGLPAFFYLLLFAWYLKGPMLQKVFAFSFQWVITISLWYLMEGITLAFIDYSHPRFNFINFIGMIIIYGIYIILMAKYFKNIMSRMLTYGSKSAWFIYSAGAVYSFVILTISRDFPGSLMQFNMLIIFVLWAFIVLCYAILTTNEKSAKEHQAETLSLQIHAMREQTDIEKKHRDDMGILRHDMRHEMAIIMELFRTGKAEEAEDVYDDWNKSLSEAVPKTLCAEPMLNAVFSRFERKAKDKNIDLEVSSNIPETIPLDTIKLSIITSNALENALIAAEKVQNQNTETIQRVISVKLFQNGTQIGLEITNPCTEPVEFDGRGFPVTRTIGHGIGVRSIAAFAEDKGYLLNFKSHDETFTMSLVMAAND
jgi:hypothetical protein